MATESVVSHGARTRFGRWFMHGARQGAAESSPPAHTDAWWKVMCLTGVDYFSTLGYQPGIAFLAAGMLSPVATLVLVLLTLCAALPMYSRVAELSPHGEGSIVLLRTLLPRWRGKTLILCLLGFASTAFVITMTLSAADAAAHILENPMMPRAVGYRVPLTLFLLAALGGVFLKGFREAVGLAVPIVAVYLLLNMVLIAWGLHHIWLHPELFPRWKAVLLAEHGNPLRMGLAALVLFPKLALGLSGFETGVAVMPLVRGDADDTPEHPAGRVRNARRLLATAALIMSVMLMGSSIVTTLLIPPEAFQEGGEANDRALAYLAHEHLGEAFGTAYDVSTIAILWFAGASAMVGLLNLVPRYLPRYGMAPEWAKATRPLVVIITAITFLVTILFKADVTAQGGAYATGVLALMTSGAFAVALVAWRERRRFWLYAGVAAIFFYTTIVNVIERPEGIKIASIFIVAIIGTSLVSRVLRSTELRIVEVRPDELGGAVHRRGSRPCGACHCEPPGSGRCRGIRRQAAGGDRVTFSRLPPLAPVRRSAADRRVRVQRPPRREWRECRPSPHSSVHQSGRAECARRAAAVHPRSDRQAATRILRVDRRQPYRLSAEVSRLGRGGCGACHTRGPAPGRACTRPPATHSPRLSRFAASLGACTVGRA